MKTEAGFPSLAYLEMISQIKPSADHVLVSLGGEEGRMEWRPYAEPNTDPILNVEVSITSAQILNMLANPITVLPALPVGQYYVGNLYFEYTFVTTGYVGGATTVLQLKSGSVAVSSGGFRPSLYMTDIIIGTTFTAQKEGDPIILAPSSANSTTGDGTLKVKLWYQIKTFG